jgi:TrmH family RNA methyltransferase
VTGGPAIVLVAPQLGENIGTAARAMLNCGLDDLRLVAPRDGWPSEKAVAAASGADSVLDKARLYPNLKAAVADLRHVYASTARDRYMVKRAVTPRLAAAEIRGFLALDEPCGVVFGPERTGLVNEDITLADTVLTVPLNPGFSSLNLAQAVMIVGYEWFIAARSRRPSFCTSATAGRRPRKSLSASSIISRRRWSIAGLSAIPTNARASFATSGTSSSAPTQPSRNCAPCTASSPRSWDHGAWAPAPKPPRAITTPNRNRVA